MTAVAARLRATQEQLERSVPRPLWTLDPARERATGLAELHASTLARLDPELAAALSEPLGEGLCELVLAQLDAFPGNLFWDLDLIAAALIERARNLDNLDLACTVLREDFWAMSELQHLYGRATPINFAYVHDFVYGFDWAKWVAREPDLQTTAPGPFSPTFLDYMRTRGHELLELIAADDGKYPSLDDEQTRNPFPFSRDPNAELQLHRALARRDLIPAPTWDPSALSLDWSTRWQTPFQQRRIDVATELGLTHQQE